MYKNGGPPLVDWGRIMVISGEKMTNQVYSGPLGRSLNQYRPLSDHPTPLENYCFNFYRSPAPSRFSFLFLPFRSEFHNFKFSPLSVQGLNQARHSSQLVGINLRPIMPTPPPPGLERKTVPK